MTRVNKMRLYMGSMRPVLNLDALFSDCTEAYVNPSQPMPGDKVVIRFRTLKNNVDHVYLLHGEESIELSMVSSQGSFDYYATEITVGEEMFCYCFRIISGKMQCYYNQRGPMKNREPYYDFRLIPGYRTPDWAKGAVFYQIFVDRFYNGDTSNDPLDREYSYIGEGIARVKDWNKYPAAMGVREFYGGDLQGVMDKLDYLQNLGVDVIYFNPLFVSPSNHKYDIQDYDYIDPHIGKIVKDEGETLAEWDNDNSHASRYIMRVTDKENLEASNELFRQLVEEAHKRGMRVILDGVFNHCGSFNKWLDRERIYEQQEGYEKGAYVSADSPYRTFFQFNDQNKWPYNTSYDGWWGHDTLPKLNYEDSPALVEDILRVAKKWVSAPYNADGWRLDVAADLGHSNEYNHQFWQKFRDAVKEANPEAIVLAEHYGDPESWLHGKEWDTVMNYDAFMEPITWFLTGMEKHSDEFRGDLLGNADSFFAAMSHHMSRLPMQSLQVAMNELSNHDHSRFLTRTNRRVGRVASLGPEAANQNINKGTFREAVVMQMTWPGAPTIYYGDEAGLCGWTDPDNRRSYPWGREDMELIEFHRDMIKIHKENKALLRGSYKPLFGSHKVIAYGRFLGDNQVVIAVNNNYDETELEIPVWEIGVENGSLMEQLMLTTEGGYNIGRADYMIGNRVLHVTLPPVSAAVYRRKM
ncbi:MAG: glycoside hydrolase family 13 protein [Lachnospiraceae bacterium]|nr:glycoside hydrolase family 13 protein [Lachnospiraceae bacterium]